MSTKLIRSNTSLEISKTKDSLNTGASSWDLLTDVFLDFTTLPLIIRLTLTATPKKIKICVKNQTQNALCWWVLYYLVSLFEFTGPAKLNSFPSGHKDVRKTSKGRLFWTRGRPIRASNGRPLDGPNATRYVRPNRTSLDVQFGLALDVIVTPPEVKWTSKGRLKEV